MNFQPNQISDSIDDNGMPIEDPTKRFEKGRIRALQAERVAIQKKTFTKWANSFLNQAGMHINDLFTDLADGKFLMKLLEIISGEKVGRPNKGVLRVQKMENVNRALNFLMQKVQLENIGAEDIVDGNERLILGLIWTIILRFQIQDIVVEPEESGERKSAKDALLLWCQRKTNGYPHVNIKDFSGSWRSGMGFNALIHAHRPDVINYGELDPEEPIINLTKAFNLASEHLGVPQLLDPEDVDVPRPDEKSIMTYIASMYHTFSKMKQESTGARRINNVLSGIFEAEQMIENYEHLVRELLNWIHMKIAQLKDRDFPNTQEGLQHEMSLFKQYRTVEKPPKYKDRSNIDGLLFQIIAKQNANGQKMYIPPEGLLLKDVESAWNNLEKAEHERELALRSELLRQERLEREAEKFNKKADLRDSWLTDMTRILTNISFGTTTSQVEAAMKKHEAINADIVSRRDRFANLSTMAKFLSDQNFHDKESIKRKNDVIQTKWKHFCDLVDRRKATTNRLSEITNMFREIESIQNELKQLENPLRSDEFGKHLVAAEDLLEKHNLADNQLSALGKSIADLNRRANPYLEGNTTESVILGKRLEEVNTQYETLKAVSTTRRDQLEQSRQFHQFWADCEEEEAWLAEKQRAMRSKETGRDLLAVYRFMRIHKQQESEIDGRWERYQTLSRMGENLVCQEHYASEDIAKRLDGLLTSWQRLRQLVGVRGKLLEDAMESAQYYADADDAGQWVSERIPLASSKDYGQDESIATALLRRHEALRDEVVAFGKHDMLRLRELAMIMTQAADKHNIKVEKLARKVSDSESEEDGEAIRTDDEGHGGEEEEIEVEVEETKMVEEEQEVYEDKKILQVQVVHTYRARDTSGRDIDMDKGETLTLLAKATDVWWAVRNSKKKEGYVPSNHLKEIEPKVVKRLVKKKVMVPQKVKVKKRVPKKDPKKTTPSRGLRRAPSARQQNNLHFDKENVEKRQKSLDNSYDTLMALVEARRKNLSDAAKLYKFYADCDSFENWMKEMEVPFRSYESLSQDVVGVKKKYEILINDLAANASRLTAINDLANEIIKESPEVSEDVLPRLKKVQESLPSPIDHVAVKARQKEINDRWEALNALKIQKEKSLEGASSIEIFNKTADELRDWIQEKIDLLEDNDVGVDAMTNDTLRRKFANIEREIAPIEEKKNKLDYLANGVKAAYPNEIPYVKKRTDEIDDLWNQLQNRMKERDEALEKAGNKHKFTTNVKDLNRRLDDLQDAIASGTAPRDAKEAAEMLAKLQDFEDEIHEAEIERERLRKLAAEVDDPAIQEQVRKLDEKIAEMHAALDARRNELEQALKAQQFYQSCDQLNSRLKQTGLLLDVDVPAELVPDVEAAIKAHKATTEKLEKQCQEADSLKFQANDLIDHGHPETDKLTARRDDLLAHCSELRDKAKQRDQTLDDKLAFAQFKQDALEISEWITDKHITASDQSYRDLTNLSKKLQRHEDFESEIKANREVLDNLLKRKDDLLSQNHPRSKDIEDISSNLERAWDDLMATSSDRGEKIQQANQQYELNRSLADAHAKLSEVEKALASSDLGNDLRSAKDLNQKHKRLESDLDSLRDRIGDLVSRGKSLADGGHFDSEGILSAVDEFDRRNARLRPQMKARGEQLAASLAWQQLAFDAATENQWIDERKAALNADLGRNIAEATNLQSKCKKLSQELAAHEPVIKEVVDRGQSMGRAPKLPAEIVRPIQAECDKLAANWNNLGQSVASKEERLADSVACQQLRSKGAEVEQWIGEKVAVLESLEDEPKDEDAVDRALAKVKTLEVDITAYEKMVNDMRAALEKLDPNSEAAVLQKRKQEALEDKLDDLKQMLHSKKEKLEQLKDFYAYMTMSDDLENWINDQLVVADSDEYGTDYDHLQVITNKWDAFKAGVDASKERLDECEKAANRLMMSKHPRSEEVAEQQNRLRDDWKLLLEYIQARDHKLGAAGEIHHFNRDWADVMDRIDEKRESLPMGEHGKDMAGLQIYIHKHEAFEAELVALETQLLELTGESKRLQQTYSGGNAESIASQMIDVENNWTTLDQMVEKRRQELKDAHHFYKFMDDARALIDWASDMEREMSAEAEVSSVDGAVSLKAHHDELCREFGQKEPQFTELVHRGETMIENGHYAADEIQDRVDQLLDVKGRVADRGAERTAYLDQVNDQQLFYRDAGQMNALTATQESRLAHSALGTSVEEVEKQQKKHEAFQRVLNSQDDRLKSLEKFANEMCERGHFDTAGIQQRLKDVAKKRGQLKDHVSERSRKLEDHLDYVLFSRELAEAEAWLDAKLAQLNSMEMEAIDLEAKMRRLQRHQAFEAEVMANENRFEHLKEQAEYLINKKRHPESANIQESINSLIDKWNRLLSDSDKRSHVLEEARDILSFYGEVDAIETWVREKEVLVAANDLGKDLDHCQDLQRKLTAPVAGKQVDDTRLAALDTLASKLIREGHSDTKQVASRLDNLRTKWAAIQDGLEQYKQRLKVAEEMHRFRRDVSDIADQIRNRTKQASSEDVGRDLSSAEQLIRRHEELNRDIQALHGQINQLGDTADVLAVRYPDSKAEIEDGIGDLRRNWDGLEKAAGGRGTRLHDSRRFYRLDEDVSTIAKWVDSSIAEMTSCTRPESLISANEAMRQHDERQAELKARHQRGDRLEDTARRMIEAEHPRRKEVEEEVMPRMRDELQKAVRAWIDWRHQLDQATSLLEFHEANSHYDAWLNSKDSQMDSTLGSSVDEVEQLITHHKTYLVQAMPSAITQKEKELDEMLAELVKEESYGLDDARTHLSHVKERARDLQDRIHRREKVLNESLRLQNFLRAAANLENWMMQKDGIASDDNYLEPTNLQSKRKRHEAFTSEVQANEVTVDAVCKQGQEIIDDEHYASTSVQERLDHVRTHWKELLDACELKGRRLRQAYDAVVLFRRCDELERWIDRVEDELSLSEHGSDLISTLSLLKRCQALKEEIVSHEPRVQEVASQEQRLLDEGHFRADEVSVRVDRVLKRYKRLPDAADKRRSNLEDGSVLYQFYRDVEDELAWIREKGSVAGSGDCGESLSDVQAFLKRHNNLMQEVQAREQLLDVVLTNGRDMVSRSHFATTSINEKLQELTSKFSFLQQTTVKRKQLLMESLEHRQYIEELTEAHVWVEEKMPVLVAEEPREEDAVQAIIKKLDAVELDAESFTETIKELNEHGEKLVEGGNRFKEDIQTRQDAFKDEWANFNDLLRSKRERLVDNLKFFAYVRETNEFIVWIKDQKTIAASDDYGNDFEHCEEMTEAFKTFVDEDLSVAQERVSKNNAAHQKLLSERNRHGSEIKEKNAEMQKEFAVLREACKTRKEALHGALKVHAFDRDCDDLLEWMEQKEAGVSMEDVGDDLAAANERLNNLSALQRDLGAIAKQVDKLKADCDKLSSFYPDATKHMSDRREEIVAAWNDLKDTAASRRDRLQSAIDMYKYLDSYKEFMAWITDIMARLAADDLATEVEGARMLINKNREHTTEIADRGKRLTDLKNQLTRRYSAHFMRADAEQKMVRLQTAFEAVEGLCERRRDLYTKNLDLRILLDDMAGLHAWLKRREEYLEKAPLGSSIWEVEDLLSRHEDFERMVAAQDDRFDAIKRLSLLEEAFAKQQSREQQAQDGHEEVLNKDRLAEIKRRETKRLAEEREKTPKVEKKGQLKGSSSLENLVAAAVPIEFEGPASPTSPTSPTRKAGKENRRKAKKTPSFSTRRKTTSFNQHDRFVTRKRASSIDAILRKETSQNGVCLPEDKLAAHRDQPPVVIRGSLERKQTLQAGGRKNPVRSWRTYYAALCGHLLAFYKNEHGFADTDVVQSLAIHGATCDMALDYQKRPNTFRLHLEDGSEFLIHVSSEKDATEWVKQINYCSSLDPALQLRKQFVVPSDKVSSSPHSSTDAIEASDQMRDSMESPEPMEVNKHLLIAGIPHLDAPPTPPRASFGSSSQLGFDPAVDTSQISPDSGIRDDVPDAGLRTSQTSDGDSGKLEITRGSLTFDAGVPPAFRDSRGSIGATYEPPKTPPAVRGSLQYPEGASFDAAISASATLPPNFKPEDLDSGEKKKKHKGLKGFLPSFRKKSEKTSKSTDV